MQFLLPVLLVAAASARPDVSHLNNGYNYNRPSGGGSIGVGSTNVPSGSYLPGKIVQPNFDPRLSGFGGTSSGNNAFFGGSDNNGYGISGSSSFDSGYNSQAEVIQDQKHVYFFAAPDEEEAPRLRIQIAPSAQKNTKIIFIKAPGYSAPIPEVIAPPSEAEDKTLVYVLVKKQDQPGPITIPAGSTVKQAKPEVYFIKYKSKEDAEHAVSGGLNEQPVGSGVQSLPDEQTFIKTIKDESETDERGRLDDGGDIRLLSGGSSDGGSISFNSGSSSSSSISEGPANKYGPPSLSGPY